MAKKKRRPTEPVEAIGRVSSNVDASYLLDADEATCRALFTATAELYKLAPWKFAGDIQVIRVDVPAMQLRGAVLSIIGRLGEGFGFVLFPSLDGFDSFLEAVAEGRSLRALRASELDIGTTWLSLDIEKASDIPKSMRDEVKRHGWPLAHKDAYPVVSQHGAGGMYRPPDEDDVRLITTIADALVPFVAQNKKLFTVENPRPVCLELGREGGVAVRFTYPAWLAGESEVND
jgi:hypothetical protein